MASSSAPSSAASCPPTAPSLMCVSQPTKLAAPTRGPSGCARYFAAVPAAYWRRIRARAPMPGGRRFPLARRHRAPFRRSAPGWPGRDGLRAREPAWRRCDDKGRAGASGCRRSPGSSRCGAHDMTGAVPAHHQRRHRPDGEGPAAPSDRRVHPPRATTSARLSQPLSVGAWLGEPALEHVLAVEMRALAIGRRRRVHDGCLLRLVEPVKVRHRRIEREERVERQCRRSCRRARAPGRRAGRPSPDRRPAQPCASPSSAPRSTMTSMRGSRPSARASLGACAQANSAPEPTSISRRVGKCRSAMITSAEIRAT